MENSKVLQQLRSEILRASKSISDKSIYDRLTRIAMDFDAQFIQWLRSKKGKQSGAGLSNGIVFETLRFLDTIRSDHPEKLSKPDFAKYFVGTGNEKFLPTLLSFSEIFRSSGSSILETFSYILNNMDMFTGMGDFRSDNARVDLKSIERDFHQHMESTVNKTYEGESGSKKTKLTRNDKKKALFYYLIDAAGNQVANAVETAGYGKLAGQIRADRLFLVNGDSLTKSGLSGPSRDLNYVLSQAQSIAKTILKRYEPEDNEYNYNLLVNTAMKFSMSMSDEDFDQYFYDFMMQKARGVSTQKRVDFNTEGWINPTTISVISLTLIMIMSQIKF